MSFKIIAIEQEGKEKFATITISNTQIKIIKSSVESYEGDKDDINYQQKMKDVRNNIHKVWEKLNPS